MNACNQSNPQNIFDVEIIVASQIKEMSSHSEKSGWAAGIVSSIRYSPTIGESESM